MPKPRVNTAIGLSRDPGYYGAVALDYDALPKRARGGYPYTIPAIRNLDTLPLDPYITIFMGENGSGKSTLIEAIAAAAGMNPEGGSKNFNLATRRSESGLSKHIKLVRGARREQDGYFLRAESMYNVATELERLDKAGGAGPALVESYGGVYLHDQSHGESFFAIVANRLSEDSFIVMDEPESALSPTRQLYLLTQLYRLTRTKRCQIVFSTHSPILMSYPGALLYRLSESGIESVKLKDTEHYTLTRDFLNDHKRWMERLLSAQPESVSASAKSRTKRENTGEALRR
jgi:predicted ATPase